MNKKRTYKYSTFVSGEKGGGKGGGGGSVYSPTEAPNTLQSNTVARIIDVLSEGEIEGLVDGLKSVYFNDTVLQNEDGTFNFSGVNVTVKTGTPDQDYIEGYPSASSEHAVGVEVTNGTPVVRSITDANATSIKVKIQIPSLTKQKDNGDLVGSKVQFKIERQSDGGGYTEIVNETISGKTTSPYEEEYRIPLDEDGNPWDIRVTRVSADSDDDATVSNKTFWSTYTKIIDNKIKYDSTAIVGVEIDARQFQEQVPQRGYEIKGIKIRVPTNYDPDTREYTGLWDGSFKLAYSNNPAWVFYDLLTSKRYGLGESIKESQIDKFALYEIAEYCDEMVPDGSGGEEPRYTFNGVINTREEAYKVLSSVASNFRGMIYWASGQVTAVTDKDEDPVRLITPANTIDGTIDYSGSSLKTRYSVAIVRYNDPEDGYRSVPIAVEDPELIQQVGWKPKEVTAFGCTSKGQAFRQGLWFLDTEKNSNEIATYRASFDNASLRPGQVIAIADPSYAGVRYGGRVSSATSGSITLDDEVTLASGETYTLSVVLPDGSIDQDLEITNTPADDEHETINIDGTFTETPNKGAMWIISGTDVAPRLFKVISISEVEKNIYEVTSLVHDTTKYARIEESIDITEDSFTILPTGKLDPPTNLTTEEYLYRASNGTIQSAVTLSWTAPRDPRVSYYQIEVQRPDTDFWEAVHESPSRQSIDIPSISSGVYQFRVRSVDAFSLTSNWSTESFSLLGLTGPPEDVTGFRINNVGPQSNLTWTEVSDLDLSHYQIRYSSKTSGAKWAEATIVAPRVPKGAEYYTVPTLIGTYMIKAIDQSDVPSDTATQIISNVGDLSQDNVVVTLTEDNDFDGVKDNVTDNGTSIDLTDTGSIGYYYFHNHLDLGSVYTSRVLPAITALGSETANTIDQWDPLSDVSAMSVADPENWETSLQIRITDDAPWYSDDNLITKPIEFDDADWTTVRSSVTADAEDAPDGDTESDFLIEDGTASATHSIFDDKSLAVDQTNVISVWSKANGRNFIRLNLIDAGATGNGCEAVFNLSNGTVESTSDSGNASGATASIEDFGNGWYRCILSGQANTSGTDIRMQIDLGESASTFSYDGDGSSGVYLWGAELLAGDTANTPTWSGWEEVIIGDYTARAFDFRIELESLDDNTTPVISDLAVTIDMPDRIERGEDITTDGTGVENIVFTSEFKEIPSIAIAAQDLDPGDGWTVTNKTTAGFTVTFTDGASSARQTTFDFVASGFGRKQ